MCRSNSGDLKTQDGPLAFKAIPLPRTTYMVHCMERKSAPPKITQPKCFNLNTDRRGAIDRKNLSIELKKPVFKSRPMPSFPEPSSPQRSTRSIDFKGKYKSQSMTLVSFLSEFKLHTNLRERKSAPPLRKPSFSGIKAREMPDFSRVAF